MNLTIEPGHFHSQLQITFPKNEGADHQGEESDCRRYSQQSWPDSCWRAPARHLDHFAASRPTTAHLIHDSFANFRAGLNQRRPVRKQTCRVAPFLKLQVTLSTRSQMFVNCARIGIVERIKRTCD